MHITIGSTCPQFLDAWSFWIIVHETVKRTRRTIYHEIIHFLWFKKWQEVFYTSNPKEFETPHLVWKVSEIAALIILNHHPRIKKLGQMQDVGYEEFQKAKIGRLKLIPFFERLYLRHLSHNTSFEDFLTILWQIAKKT